MSVRAKMRCTWIREGQVGCTITLDAVYEGTNELQQISENAIFGDATPSGSLTLVVPQDRADKFKRDEEYYIDMDPQDPARGRPTDAIMHWGGYLAFRADQNTNYPDSPIEFRYVFDGVGGGLSVHVKNPTAIKWMDENGEVLLSIKLARGRKSDEEIAMREKLLADQERTLHQYYPQYAENHRRNGGEPESLQEYVARNTQIYRQRLAWSRGEEA